MDEDDKLTSQAIEADPWNAGPRSAASLQDDLVLEPIPTAVREPEVLAVRVSELAKLVEAEPGFSGDIAASRQDTLTPAMQSVSGPEEAAALGRMNDAETQDYAAHLGTLAAISLDASGQHDDADALRLEAQARTEIANNFRNPTPTNDGPGSGIEQPSSEPDGQADFRQDAEAAARANGFGPTATLVFMENTDKAPDMIGTNPEIVFEEARASVAPGGNDYSALHAQPMPEQAEPAAQFLDLSNEQQPEATMTRGITLGMGPGGATIMEVNHSPNVQEADAALEATNYAAPFRPGTQGMEEVAEAPQAATAEQYTQTGREAVAELPAAETPTQGRGWLTDFLAETKDEIEGDRGGAENEASHEPTEAFRSFGR
jgi:hypothetical protein